MQRFLTIPLVALGLLACGPSVAEGDAAPDSCWEALLTCADTELGEETTESAPTISQTSKDAGVWLKERLFRHLRVDSEWYPQRQHSEPS